MKSIKEEIKEYMLKNNLSNEDCANILNIKVEDIENLDNEEFDFTEEEKTRIQAIIAPKISTGKKINKILDLIFRLGSCVMALVALLLCINGIADYKIVTALLSIGLVCSSLTMLPKIEK